MALTFAPTDAPTPVATPDARPFRFLSVCSGVEAASQAWHKLGWETAAVAEIEPFPAMVLHHHYGCGRPRRMPNPLEDGITVKERKARHAAIKAVRRLPVEPAPGAPINFGDFTRITDEDLHALGRIDLVVGGTPCQDYSVAGKRAGLAGARGNLTRDYARLARRIRPEWLVWENVPGVFSTNEGRDFGAVLAAFAGHDDGVVLAPPPGRGGSGGGWRSAGIVPAVFGPDGRPLGYGLAWRVLDAQYLGVPQRRRRVLVVGYLGDWRRAAAVLLELDSLRRDPPPSRSARKDPAPVAAFGISSDCLDRSGEGSGGTAGERPGLGITEEASPTIKARRANAVAFNNTGHGWWNDAEVATGLRDMSAGSGSKEATLISAVPLGLGDDGELARALNACHTASGRHDVSVDTFIAHTLKGDGFDGSEDGTGRGTPLVAVAFAENSRAELRLEGGDGQTTGALKTGGGKAGQSYPAAMVTAGVRRLLPVECERLQAMADDFTRIPIAVVKKPAAKHFAKYRDLYDANADGTWTLHAADGPRYKAIGNSMHTGTMNWIGRRIEMVRRLVLEPEKV